MPMFMRAKKVTIILSLVSASLPIFSATLAEVYNQALANDPTFKKAKASYLAAKEALPIAQSSLLPNISLSADINRNYARRYGPNNGILLNKVYYNSNDYGLTIGQSILNFASFAAIKGASYDTQTAHDTYLAAAQQLIQRTASAYFAVLNASDTLRFTISQKRAVYQQLKTAQQKYKVGLIAITGVYDAQASYDAQIAQEILDKNALDNSIENLRTITNHVYPKLSNLKNKPPLYVPNPKNINAWVKMATQKNYLLQADNNALKSAHAAIGVQSAAHLPTLGLTGSLTNTQTKSPGPSPGKNVAGVASLNLSFPIFQGGAVFANTKKAEYAYQGASQQREIDYRAVVSGTRQAYLGVIAGISSIKASYRSVVSNQKSLEATEAGYKVGTRTMVNVLTSLSALNDARKTYSKSQYDYLNSLINLKLEAGTLGPNDITQISSWLTGQRTIAQRHNTTTHRTKQRQASNPQKKSTLIKFPKKTSVIKKETKHLRHAQFAIQLFSSNTQKDAKRFIANNQLSRAWVRQPTTALGNYTVIQGPYNTLNAAKKAMGALSASLKKQMPWVVLIPKANSQPNLAATKSAMVKHTHTIPKPI